MRPTYENIKNEFELFHVLSECDDSEIDFIVDTVREKRPDVVFRCHQLTEFISKAMGWD